MVDRDHLAEVARSGPDPVFATVSGAHLYGFASPDSDIDLRGAFLLPVRQVLGLHPPQETVSVTDEGTQAVDWVAHDLRKFVRMVISHNGYVLEQLFSPLVVLATPAFEELRTLGTGCLTANTVRHYQGFARGRRRRLHEPEPTVKHLLYAYRVLLTGIHLMRTGELIANITVLNERFNLARVAELVARKSSGSESMLVDEHEVAAHDATLDDLEAALQEAHERTSLPEEPTTKAALEDLVIRLRLADERRDSD